MKDSDWSFDDNLDEFSQDIEAKSNQKRKEALERLSSQVEKAITQKLADPISLHMNSAIKPNLWKTIILVLQSVLSETEAQLKAKLGGYGFDAGIGVAPDLIEESVKKTKLESWERFISVVAREVSDSQVQEKLRKK